MIQSPLSFWFNMTFTAELTTTGFLITWDASEASSGTVTFSAGLHEDDMTEYLSGQALTGSSSIAPPKYDRRLANFTGKLDVVVSEVVRKTTGYLPLFPGLSFADIALANRQVSQHFVHCRAAGKTVYLYRSDPTMGTDCPDCVDPATGDRFTLDCETCGGSGRTGGFLGPFEIGLLPLSGRENTIKVAAGQGDVFAQPAILSCMPRPITGDYLLLREEGRTLIVGGQTKVLTQVRAVPVTVSVLLMDVGSDEDPAKSLLGFDAS